MVKACSLKQMQELSKVRRGTERYRTGLGTDKRVPTTQNLEVDGIIQVTRAYISTSFVNKRRLQDNPHREFRGAEKLQNATTLCGLLRHLDERSALPFSLNEVV